MIGLPSAGVHANGFTLVRRVLEDEDYAGDDLLAPTRLYLDDVRRAAREPRARAFAHVTGGGILGNLARVVPDGPARRDRLGRLGAPARVRLARPARRRGRAAPRLQPRDRVSARSCAGSRRRARDREDRAQRDRRARLAARGRTCRRCSTPACRSSRSPRTSPTRARSGGPKLPGFPRPSFPLETYADRDARDAAMADWLEAHGVDLVVCAGLHAPPASRRSSRASPSRVVNVHPAPLPAFPGRASARGRAGGGGRRGGCDSALRGRGRRHGRR